MAKVVSRHHYSGLKQLLQVPTNENVTLEQLNNFIQTQLLLGRVKTVIFPHCSCDIALVEIPTNVTLPNFYPQAMGPFASVLSFDNICALGTLSVQKMGASTGYTYGKIGYGSLNISCDHESSSLKDVKGDPRILRDCLMIHSDCLFSAKGDSGGAVYTDKNNGGPSQLVGIMVGTSNHADPLYIASPLDLLTSEGYSWVF